MALSYKPVDRDQLFLLPPSMREWLAEGHLVWFVLDVVERLDTSALHARHPNDGVGRRAYDPEMLLALLLYAYCGGVRSSRQIERLCEVDVAFRVICAGLRPDHSTIARFRQDYDEVAQQLFVDALELCAAAGMVRVGVIAVDGTKIAADASSKANRTLSQIVDEVAAMFADAADRDEQEDRLFGDARGDEVPPDLADRGRRAARLDEALREFERRRAARAEQERAAQQLGRERWERRRRDAAAKGNRPSGRRPAAVDVEVAEEELKVQEERARERAQRRAQAEADAAAAGGKMPGPTPDFDNQRDLRDARRRAERARARAAQRAARDEAGDEDRVNTTDPDSRVMKTAGGFMQGYNAQAAATEDGVFVAGYTTPDANDVGHCEPMIDEILANLAAVGISDGLRLLLFDAGYLSERNLTVDGPDRLIATGKASKLRKAEPAEGPPPPDATPIEAMEHRLRTPEGAAEYAKRQRTIEPVFGDVKDNRGLRRFARRGLAAVNAEWNLVMTANNMMKLFRYRQQPAGA